MKRDIRTTLVTISIAVSAAMSATPGVADAGIITDLKTTRPSDFALHVQNPLVLQDLSLAAVGNSDGESSNTGVQPGRKPGDPRNAMMLLTTSEYDQISKGLITAEEASSGCGGAQVAGGDASWGALALVGLFLAWRRRR